MPRTTNTPRPASTPRHGSTPGPTQRPAPNAGGSQPRKRDPDGAFWMYGRHAIIAALENEARTFRRLVVSAEAQAGLPAQDRITAEVQDNERIGALLPPGAVHQGLAAFVEPLPIPTLAEALERDPEAAVLVLDQVTDPRNVGAILRSAAAFGAAAVIVQERHAPPEGGAMARAAAGALERIPLMRAVNIARTLDALKQAGLWVVGLDGEAPTTLAGTGLTDRRLALVLGSEDEGMRRLTREACDSLARLPQTASMESLNVSVAAGVALYAVMAARLEKS